MSKESTYGQKSVGSVHGLPIRANIVSFVPSTGEVYVQLPLQQSSRIVPVKLPAGWIGPRGQISAGYPEKGTTIFVVQGQGNEWVFSSYDQPDSISGYDGDGTKRVSPTNKFKPGRWITLVENNVSLYVDPKEGVVQGGSVQFTQADPSTGIWSSRFFQEMHFSDAHRSIQGPVFRDLRSNNSRDVSSSSLSGHLYNSSLTEIGLDPRTKTSISMSSRNPTLAESREMYYEFISSFEYTDDQTEERLYAGEDAPSTRPYQRKRSRTDTMSLSLDQPNFLAEFIIGTVVDIYGNILDINRNVLPSGIIDSLNLRKSEENSDIVFRKLREQLRKSIAYHFEINARKESVVQGGEIRDPGVFTPKYPNEVIDYSRDRSRFSFDVDKEGQFKMNVPASSEVGNISLLTRHENFSNLKGAEEEVDRGQFIRNITDNTDIKLEPFGKGVISLISNEETLKGYSAPVSRFDGERIKLGTAFHDISGVLELHKFTEPYKNNGGYADSLINKATPVEDVVSSEVIVAGPGANAGGRSGTISLDGMLSLNIGANTIDRQSLWLDTAGGIVGAIGRDRFNRSMSFTLDGDMLVQVGGATVADDSRFSSLNNEARDGVIDIRVWNSGSFHTIRVSPQGIDVHTPQRLNFVSEGEMRFKSVNANMYFDAESIYFYGGNKSNSRMVLRATEGASGRTI
ncbi:MAG: hypothetical protein ACFFG0_32550 [Candidatus Thorarchaeota archaeon]